MKVVRIPYVTWRNGRPRFVPGAKLRALGFQGEDLKTPDGSWMTLRQAEDWSRVFGRKLSQIKSAPVAVKPAAARRQDHTTMPVAWYSLHALFKDWLGSPDVQDLRPASIRNYRYAADVLEDDFPMLWAADAGALDHQICQAIYDKLRKGRGDHAAFNTARALGVAIQWGIRHGKVHYAGNPAHKLKLRTPKPRVRAASIEEIDHFVRVADQMGRFDIADMIMLACWTGQRQADRLGLTLHSREEGVLRFKQAKTDVIVEIPEAPALARRIDAALERRKLLRLSSPLLVIDEINRQPFRADHYRHVFDDLRKAAAEDLPGIADLRDQDFRDTAVTWLARAGCTIPQICAITGHSFTSANSILKHYLAPHRDLAREAISKLADWHNNATNGKDKSKKRSLK